MGSLQGSHSSDLPSRSQGPTAEAPGIMIGQPICAVQSVRPVREQVQLPCVGFPGAQTVDQELVAGEC